MRERRVVITGLGAITPIGNDVPSFWEGLIKGRNGVSHITKFDAEQFDTKIAAEVKGFDVTQFIDPKEARRMDPFTHYAMVAGAEAIKDSGLSLENEDPHRIGAIVGSGIGGMIVYHIEHKKLLEKGPRRVSPFFIPMMIPDIVPGYLSMRFGFLGPNYSTVSACASGSHSIGVSFMHITRGDADVMVTGGAESVITEMAFAGFNSMKAISTRNNDPARASRPFDAERDGFVIGEGAGIIILEELSHAVKRGAKIYAEMVGIGFTADGYHITAPHPEGEGAAQAMKKALQEGEINPEEVDYINAHGTSTPLNDRIETVAIKSVFGDHAYKVPVSSTKSMTGHLVGAAGAVEAAISVMTIRNGIIPPTINLTHPDPECDLDYVPHKARQANVTTVLSNSFGFGGHNSVLVFRRYE